MALQLCGVEAQGNPFIDEGAQALVVGQLLADGGGGSADRDAPLADALLMTVLPETLLPLVGCDLLALALLP